MEIIGYILALLIGVTLGLIGSGGSILALPILVYFFDVPATDATHYSLFIVGITAAFGTIQKFREKFVDTRSALFFLVPSLAGVFISRHYFLPMMPEVFFGKISKDIFLLILFAIIMLIAAVSMIRSSREPDIDCDAKIPDPNANHYKTSIAAFVVGVLTGLLGAGGGFLIVPVLALLKGHCMRRATGTSLLIIAVNALVGFASDINASVNWPLVGLFTAIAGAGMFAGIRLSNKIAGAGLKRIFGILVLGIGLFILIKELWLN